MGLSVKKQIMAVFCGNLLDILALKLIVTGSWKTYLLGTLVGLIQSSISPRKKKVLV